MLSRPIISASTLLKNDSVVHESYIEQYAHDVDFQDVYASLSEGNQVEENDYHMHKNLMFHYGKLCIPQGERLSVMRESHSSLIAGHFGVSKTMVHLQRYCYWPRMIDSVLHFIRGCYMCSTSKPSNRGLGCTRHYRYHQGHGRVSSWTLLEFYLSQENNMIIFM